MPLTYEKKPYDFDRVFRLAITAAFGLGAIWLIFVLRSVLIPFAIALLLAYLMNPVADALESRLKNRTAAVMITVAGSLIVAASLLVALVPIVMNEIAGFSQVLASYDEKGSPIQRNLQHLSEHEWFSAAHTYLSSPQFAEQLRTSAKQFLPKALEKVVPAAAFLAGGLLSVVIGVMGVVVIVLYWYFLLIDYKTVAVRWKDYLPPGYRDDILGFLGDFGQAMSRYFRGQLIIAMIMGVLFAVGFKLVGIRMAILLGLFVGALNVIPYLQIVGLAPAVALAALKALEQDRSVLWMIVAVLAVFAVVQVIQDGLLTPRIMGKATGLRPIWIMLGVFVWGELLGFLGLILAIPLTLIAQTYYVRWVRRQEKLRRKQETQQPVP